MQQEVAPQVTVEQQLLTALEALQGQVRDLRTNLMGSGEPEHENEHGRLPRAETNIKQNARDVEWLKDSKADAIDLRELKMEVNSLKETRVSATAYLKSAQVVTGLVTGLIGALGGGLVTVLAQHLLLAK
jgi:hypothetical protein